MKPISSSQNPRYKAALSLQRNRGRKRSLRFLIQAQREIARGLEAGWPIEEGFCHPESCNAAERELCERLASRGIPVWTLPPALLQSLQYGEGTAGLVAVGRRLIRELGDLRLGTAPLVVVCDHLEKPGNLGAIVRTADAVGADAVLLADPLVDALHPNAIRASTGCVFTMPIVSGEPATLRDWLRAKGIQICTAHPTATRCYSDIDFRRPTSVVLGNEAAGLHPAWRGDDLISFRLPMRGVADSLNVSVTAAVVLFEANRQRSEVAALGPRVQ